MANQPGQNRPWFRLPSLARPAPESVPIPAAPEPAPVQPRPVIVRPAFRPVTQPQEPTSSQLQKSPPKPGGVASVPSSPQQRASLPTSPVQQLPKVSAPTSSVPPSPAVSKPPAQTSSVPSSPATKPMPTTFSVPSSPTPKPAPVTSSLTTSPAKPTTNYPVQYPRTINPVSPPRSPKVDPTAPPPSPLVLPPPKIKSEPAIPLVAEQKSVLVQKTIDKPKLLLNNSDRDLPDAVKSSIGKHETHAETKEKVHHKKLISDSEDGGMRIITIAGENKGAFMEVIRSPNKKHTFEGHPHHLHSKDNESKSNGNKWRASSSSSDEGGKPKMKNKNHKGKQMNSLPLSAFTNSNVQGVNSSIVYNSSCTHHDPGVHFALARKPIAGGGHHVNDHNSGHHD